MITNKYSLLCENSCSPITKQTRHLRYEITINIVMMVDIQSSNITVTNNKQYTKSNYYIYINLHDI